MIIPLTGVQYEIEGGHYRATVTELGAGLRELTFRGQPVLAGYEADELPPAGAGQLLAPWPNRVDGGRYVFGGTEYQLALTEPARENAIHGLTRWMAWTAVQQDASSVRLRSAPHGQQGYPFCVEIEAEYRLDPDTGLRVTVTARNRGSRAAPYGTGSHPYLTVRTAVGRRVRADAAGRVLAADGRPRHPVGAAGARRRHRVRLPPAAGHRRHPAGPRADRAEPRRRRPGLVVPGRAAGGNGPRLGLWAGDGYGWLQVFTGDPLGPDRRRKAVAIEPMTCPPNAFVTADDLLVLEPGERVTHSWGIQAF